MQSPNYNPSSTLPELDLGTFEDLMTPSLRDTCVVHVTRLWPRFTPETLKGLEEKKKKSLFEKKKKEHWKVVLLILLFNIL